MTCSVRLSVLNRVQGQTFHECDYRGYVAVAMTEPSLIGSSPWLPPIKETLLLLKVTCAKITNILTKVCEANAAMTLHVSIWATELRTCFEA